RLLLLLGRAARNGWLLVAVGDATALEVIGRQLNLDAITGQDADVVHAHLPRDVGQHLVAVLELDPEHRVRERLDDRPFEDDRVFFWLRQNRPPRRNGAAPPPKGRCSAAFATRVQARRAEGGRPTRLARWQRASNL